MTCTNAKFQVLAVLGLTTCLGLYPTLGWAAPVNQVAYDRVKEYCDAIGGQFLEVSDGSYGCLVDAPGGTLICTAGGTCHESMSPEAGGGKKPGAPEPRVDADLSPDAGTTKGGLEPKLQTAPLSPR